MTADPSKINWSDLELLRRPFETMCRKPHMRSNYPLVAITHHKWWPYKVRHSATLSQYTDTGAWDFIADCLRDGCAIKYQGPSKEFDDHAYVIVQSDGGAEKIYMKFMADIELEPDFKVTLIGLSFHYEHI